MLRIQPSSEKKLNVIGPGLLTWKEPVKTALKLAMSPSPAFWSLPWAGTVLHEPSGCCTTFVNGWLFVFTPVWLEHGTVPTGGLKLTTGNSWVKVTAVDV